MSKGKFSEIVDKLKSVLAASTTPVACTNIKTKDGKKILSIEGDKAAGAKVDEVNTDGTKTPLVPGSYPLTDGSTITLEKDGIISDVKMDEAPASNMDEVQTPVSTDISSPDADAEGNDADADTEDDNDDKEILDRLTALEQAIASISEILSNQQMSKEELSKVKSENKELKKSNKELSNQPAAPKADFKKIEEVKIDSVSKFEHFKESKIKPSFLSEIREQIKSKQAN